MTQLEFDKLMNAIRQEQNENNETMRAELDEIEGRRIIARKEYDDAHDRYKAVCDEITLKQRELKEANAQYYERKKNLIKAFPKAFGVRTEGSTSSNKKRECFAIRAKMIAHLKEEFKDSTSIDVESIDVHFNIDDDDVNFTAILPKIKIG